MRKLIVFGYMLMFCLIQSACSQNSNDVTEFNEVIEFQGELKVLALNTWQEGTSVEGGFEALANIIKQTKADVVLLSEIRNYNGTVFSERILQRLKIIGLDFFAYNSQKSPLILSKFPIESHTGIASNSLTKTKVKLSENKTIAFYAAHLDYTHYACYLPRGYDGINWSKLPAPIVDVEKILKQNIDSQRDEAIAVFIQDAKKEKEKGNLVILGGDFNEPSHLDWGVDMKDKFDHNGTVVPWHTSVSLQENGFKDAYRVKYPDPVSYPGITWPAYNIHVNLEKLLWAKDADERDRIDFIYYASDTRINVTNMAIVGPVASIAYGSPVASNPGEDTIITPNGIWPTDHKGVLATFDIK